MEYCELTGFGHRVSKKFPELHKEIRKILSSTKTRIQSGGSTHEECLNSKESIKKLIKNLR